MATEEVKEEVIEEVKEESKVEIKVEDKEEIKEEIKQEVREEDKVQIENLVKEELGPSDSQNIDEKAETDNLSVKSDNQNSEQKTIETLEKPRPSAAGSLAQDKSKTANKSNEKEPKAAKTKRTTKTATDKIKSAKQTDKDVPKTKRSKSVANKKKEDKKSTERVSKTPRKKPSSVTGDLAKRKTVKKNDDNMPKKQSSTKFGTSRDGSKISVAGSNSETEEAPAIDEEEALDTHTSIDESESTAVETVKKKKKKYVQGKRFEYEFDKMFAKINSAIEPAENVIVTAYESHESDLSTDESQQDLQKDENKDENKAEEMNELDIPETRASLEAKKTEEPKTIMKKKRRKRKKKWRRVRKARKRSYHAAQPDIESISQRSFSSRISHKMVTAVAVPEPEFVLKSEDESSYDSATSEEDKEAYDTLRLKSAFLREFEDLPALSDILSTSSTTFDFGRVSEEASEIRDDGRFVKTITSGSLQTVSVSDSISYTQLPEEEEKEMLEEEANDLETELDLKSIDIILDSKADEREQEVDASTAMLDMEKAIVVDDEDDLMNARQLAQEAAALRTMTIDFLHELFNEVVHTAEYKDARAKMAASLDKKRLWNELKLLSTRYEGVLGINRLLNRKMIEHYKRNKNIRAITPLHHHLEHAEKLKYDEFLINYDTLLQKEMELTSHQVEVIANANIDVAAMESEMEQREIEFEELVRKTLIHNNFNFLPRVVDRELKKMEAKRAEISELRLKVLFRQHKLANLHAKMNELENFSDSLTMSGFMHMQTEIQALGKKIEERNTELNRLRGGCNANLHILTHMREKQELLSKDLHAKTLNLNLLRKQRQKVREQLFSEKLLRNRLRQEMIEVSQQGGLLDKPTLMVDYDETSDKVAELRTHVSKLKTVLAELMNKIELITRK